MLTTPKIHPKTRINNRFEVVRHLNEGTFGNVFLVRDLRHNGREAALKILKNAAFISDLQNEIETVKKLSHPNLITFYEEDQDKATAFNFFVMELASGQPLSRWLKDPNPLTLTEIVEIGYQSLSALEYLHVNRKIVHLDIKPANLIFDRDSSHVQLVDFGEARKLKERGGQWLTHFEQTPGTQGYQAPELLAAEAGKQLIETGGAVDIYALGVVLGQLLMKSYIPLNLRPEDLLSYGQKEQLDPGICDMVASMLATDPAGRPDAASLGKKFENLQKQFSTQAHTTTLKLPFLGRVDEQALVKGRLELGLAKRGGLFVIAGVAGVGKSRLVQEIIEDARQLDFITVYNRPSSRDTGPFSPLVRLLQTCLERTGLTKSEPEVDFLEKSLPELKFTKEALITPSPVATGPEEVARLLEALEAFFKKISYNQPFLICLDDAQSCDRALLEVLKKLDQRLLNLPVIFSLAFRSEEPTERRRLKMFFEKADLTLRPLSNNQIRALLSETFGKIPDPLGYLDKLAQILSRRTGGRPFYLLDSFKLLQHAGIGLNQAGWQRAHEIITENTTPPRPGGHFEVIGSRVELLEPVQIQIAKLAALLGYEFELHLLELLATRLLGISGNSFKRAYKGLLQAGIIEFGEDTRYWRFSHDLLYQAVYYKLTNQMRRQAPAIIEEYYNLALHDPCTGYQPSIEELPFTITSTVDDSRTVALFAQSYRNSPVIRCAAGYALLAGWEALKANANDIALYWFEEVLTQLEKTKAPFFAEECEESGDLGSAHFVRDKLLVERTRFWTLKGI